jgi:hypothetical protein
MESTEEELAKASLCVIWGDLGGNAERLVVLDLFF